MTKGRLALMDKVWVCMSGGRDAIVKGVALTGYRLRTIAADVREESRLAEARLGVVLGSAGPIV